MPKYCGGCGGAVADNAKFCPTCGADLAQFADKAPAASAEGVFTRSNVGQPTVGTVNIAPQMTQSQQAGLVCKDCGAAPVGKCAECGVALCQQHLVYFSYKVYCNRCGPVTCCVCGKMELQTRKLACTVCKRPVCKWCSLDGCGFEGCDIGAAFGREFLVRCRMIVCKDHGVQLTRGQGGDEEAIWVCPKHAAVLEGKRLERDGKRETWKPPWIRAARAQPTFMQLEVRPINSGKDLCGELVLSVTEAFYGVEKRIQYARDGVTTRIAAKIPQGVKDGARIRFRGGGSKGDPPGDLILIVRVEHEKREGA